MALDNDAPQDYSGYMASEPPPGRGPAPAFANAPAYSDAGGYDDVPLPPDPGPEHEPASPAPAPARPSVAPDFIQPGGNPAPEFYGGREVPYNEEAEQSVLGGMMLSSNAIVEAVEIVSEQDFYLASHQIVYRAIADLFIDGQTHIDPVLVHGWLDRHGLLKRVGGPAFLHTLVSKVPTAANTAYYARIVAEKSTMRKLVAAGTRIAALGYNGDEGSEVEQLVDRAQQEIFDIGRKKSTNDYSILREIMAVVNNELAELAEHGALNTGVQTGFYDLDEMTNGLHAGQMIIIAARPGVGKSTLALDIMRSCSISQGKPSILFSLEMSKSEVVMRLLSAQASISMKDLRSGRLDEQQWTHLTRVITALDNTPLYVDDSPNLTMMEIRTKARRLKQEVGLGLVVVDYLQLMSSGKRVESRQQEVSEFSRQLKLLAKELEVPLIAISQLNRGPESRIDKRPQVADLRESGSLEQDADMVMLLYRPDSQGVDNAGVDDPRAGDCDIILAKHRGGPVGTVTVVSQLQYSRFSNFGRQDEPM
ncbi:MAG: replicative DNA helicase [Bifidobacterium sp.]|nr:replicative DNA helicase [Bifidobacterium sp.]